MLTGLVSTSVVAKILGPTGVALLGNFRNFITSLETISILGFHNGIVKYVAQHNKDENELKKIISTVFFSILGSSILGAILLFVFANYWNVNIFGEKYNFSIIFKTSALTLPFFAMNIFLVAIINGLSQFKKVIYINITGNIVSFGFTIAMILKYQTFGALLSMALIPTILFIICWFWISKTLDLKKYILPSLYDFSIIKNLSEYSLMAFVSAFCMPLIYLKIRTNTIETIGIENAGNWEAMNRMSAFYMIFVSKLLSLYFFPKLSQSQSNKETKNVFLDYYKTVIPMFVLGSLVLYFLRDLLISVIYSERFTVLSDLFFWQLIGDFFKVCSLILGYQFFAKKLTIAFLSTEILSIVTLYFSSIFLMKTYGTEGLVMAHTTTYIIYFLIVLMIFRKIFVKSR